MEAIHQEELSMEILLYVIGMVAVPIQVSRRALGGWWTWGFLILLLKSLLLAGLVIVSVDNS